MFLSLPLIVAWIVVTASALLGSYRRHKQFKRLKAANLRLQRTVDKLKKKNGKVWYDLMDEKEAGDLTATGSRTF